ncbi:MAG: PBP1A family penicillin-binding protein [Rhodomicrobium sp.]|nr:PBP1A family penicillin-binding protein [Rhodomicrobium sp.]
MGVWRARQAAEVISRFRAAAPHLRFAALCLWLLASGTARWLLRLGWRAVRRATVWLVTESPLSEPRRSAHRPLLRLIPWVIVAIGWIAITIASIAAYYASILPDPRQAMILRVPPNLTILARGGEFIAERGMRRDYVAYKDSPPHLVKAVLATEDRRFFYHFGLDPIGLARAASTNWRSGEVQQGGSTITQQLAKNLFLEPKRTWTRKAEEFVLALWLESRFTKQEILELYLNRVYFGGGNYGIGAAAHFYFGKAPQDITLAEAALLAGLIKAPSYYSPAANPSRAKARASDILRLLAETDEIDINQYAEALANPARLKVQPSKPGFGFVADWVAEVAPMLTGETNRNLIVETTIDAGLQLAARNAVETIMRTKGRTARASEAAVLLLTPDGAIRAMIGGRNHAESQFNRAVRAMRQPGSAFKPFIYLAAIEAGYTPDTLIDDSPVEIVGWRPTNFGGTYRGQINLRTALTHSSNMAAIRLMLATGPGSTVEVANRLGVLSARDVGPTLALGTSETTLLEMTSSFAVFANGGLAVAPEVVERIRDDSGKVLFERSKRPAPRIVSARAVSAMNDMMNSVVAGGTAAGAALDSYPAAAKTGTSQKFKDAWIIGYTAQWVCGVWMGNDNARPMRGVTGGSLPAEIWKELMLKAQAGLMPQPLPGTGVVPAFLQRAAEAIGLADVPSRSPFRKKELSSRPSSPRAAQATPPAGRRVLLR